MNRTKKKIILSGIALFNELGISNVRNSDIAKEAGISLSNFNYHFGTKKDLVLAVTDYMLSILEEKVYGNRLLITGGQGLTITKSYFEFEQEFSFFYLDTQHILQTYPELKEEVQRQIAESIQIIKNLNYLSIGMGYMKPEPPEMPGLYENLAEQVWINNHFLLGQMKIRGVEDNPIVKGLESSFCINYPYLTEKGVEAYKLFILGVKEEVKMKTLNE